MSKSAIPQKLQSAIWARAGGRCQYRGCNVDLVGDLIAGRRDGLYGFIAHIVADSADGPRGDPVRSAELAKDLSNLMLMGLLVGIILNTQRTWGRAVLSEKSRAMREVST